MKNSFFFRKGLICGTVAAVAVIILALPVWIMPESAAAGSLANCESSSGAPDVTSVRNACNYCRTGSGSSRGVLWIGGANSDVSRVSMNNDVVNDGGIQYVTLALRGQVYSCRQTGTSSNIAWYIWFGKAGHDNANDTPVDFIENNSISSGRSLYRGAGQGATYTWYSPLGQMTSIRINLTRFIEVATLTSERDADGDGVIDSRVYEYTVSVNRCFSPNSTGKYRNSSECYGDDSKIIIELSGVPCDPDTDPDCCGTCDEPEEANGSGYFWSKSKVEAVAGSDVPGGIEAKSDEDGSEYILFSSDQDTVQVKFTHYMGYTNSTTFNMPLHTDHPPNPDTTYGVTQTADGSVSGSGAVSGVTFSGNAYGTAEAQVQESTVTVHLNEPGDTVKVCQKISYSPKNITYTGWTVNHGTTLAPNTDWHYSWSGSGNGASDVCATVTRPTEPGGGGPNAGSVTSDIMFAGQDSTIGWDLNGPNWDVRRLREWQAVVYRIPVNVPHNSALYTGTGMPLYGNQPLNVCGWYGSWDYCNVLSGRVGSFSREGEAHSYGPSADIVVPDTVGYKYCNSFGYRYEYWWYSSSSDGDGWHMDKSYWYIYDAACRTIAKKPSASIWNGSFMTADGVKTSLSWRFDNAVMGIETSAAGGRSLYGSWSEFMSVVGGANVGLTSGSIISRGHSQGNDEICDGSINNVALTIRNNNCSVLGHSQIFNNATYRYRLETYLEKYGSSTWNKVSSIASIDTSRTNVVNLDGDVTLSSNIELANGPYDSIYKIPQVVIFINGDLKITKDVTRIDAWLIVSGDINTCSDFVPGSTQSEAVYTSGATYNSGVACSKQLIFNGPVLARSLTARRSYGSDNLVTTAGTFGSDSGYGKWAAGEVFNFRADTFLWAYAQAGRYNSSYTESYSRELAPRY